MNQTHCLKFDEYVDTLEECILLFILQIAEGNCFHVVDNIYQVMENLYSIILGISNVNCRVKSKSSYNIYFLTVYKNVQPFK
jgi:hypothetical protein